VKEIETMELFDKHFALDPSKFDQAAFADDIKALFADGYFDDILQDEDEIYRRAIPVIAKHYGNGELLLLLDEIQRARMEIGTAKAKLDKRITQFEAETKGHMEGVESAANLRGILGEIMGMKAQGDRIEGKVGEVGKIVVEKKAETEKRLAGQTAKANELQRKINQLRGNDTK